ncbi:MAG TPA: hypothetical protein PLL09_08280 [Flavobacterium sp.]|uniref:Uncharacterized protein n=2 Tax=Flavobacterium TaxID=237 RepID=A0A4Q1KVA4_9FLAO|nr:MULTISPECIES: hypothetical protein [Flavobacterium]RXR33590.1 hypothetical protein EQG68_05025 [Flavobacterium piscinae]HRE77807.1 hypothetical protein [Flavobacterium sp.]
MKKIITILFLFFSFLGFSQKVKFKKGDVIVDDVVWMKYTDCGTFDSTCSLYNLKDEEIIFFKYIFIEGAVPKTQANPQGRFGYVEVNFIGLKKSFEIQETNKNIIEILYKSKIFNSEGDLDEEKVDRLVQKYGSDFSPRFKNYGN